MKGYILKFATIFAIFLSGFMISEAQFVIKVRPVPPVMRARPVRPGATYIWIDGDYVWRGGTYVYTDGYWAVPPHRNKHWKPGHWRQSRGGWVWIRGHWR